jgi:hypothetical protein
VRIKGNGCADVTAMRASAHPAAAGIALQRAFSQCCAQFARHAHSCGTRRIAYVVTQFSKSITDPVRFDWEILGVGLRFDGEPDAEQECAEEEYSG